MRVNCGFQLAVSQVLDLGIDRQHEIAPLLRQAHAFNVFDNTAQPVLDHPAAPRLAREPVLIGELDTLLAAIVDVGETEQMGGEAKLRVAHLSKTAIAGAGGLRGDDL